VDGPRTDPLLLGIAAGDERAFAALYDRYAARMYRTALRILGSSADAEDVVQDVFLALVRSRKKLDGVHDLTAYLFAALRRGAALCARRRGRAVPASPTAVDEAIAPVDEVEPNHPLWDRLERAITSLPTEQREVLTLKFDGELTFAQIAEVTGLSIGTVASRYHYALGKLKGWLFTGGAAVGGKR
jgi:RNA polymerase sigma-70 factor, ECF subfamily